MITANIYNELTYNPNKPNITILFETAFTKEIRIAMEKGTQMKEHQTPYPIVIELISGSINFGVSGKTHTLKKGDIVALEGSVPHDLKATEPTIIRLTLTKYDSSNRVKNIID